MDQKIITLLLECLHQQPDRVTADRVAALTHAECQALMDLAIQQNVSGLFSHRLRVRGLEAALPPDIQSLVLAAYRRTVVMNLSFTVYLARIVAILQANAIPVIALKGIYLAAVVYGNLALREMCDIDLLLPRSQIEPAIKLLATIGYQQKAGHQYTLETNMLFQHDLPLAVSGDVRRSMVELHWTITSPPSSNSIDPDIDPNELWSRAVPAHIGEVDVLGLSAEDLLLHLCVHTSYHHCFEFGLRPSCDIAATLQRFGDSLDWSQIIERARRWQWVRGTYLALRLARDLVGAAVPMEILQQLQPSPFDEAIVAVARGQIFTDQKLATAIPLKFARLQQSQRLSAKLSAIWHAVFIARWEIAGRYGVSRTSPFLYLYYLVRLKDLLSNHTRAIFNLVRGDPNLSPMVQRKAMLLNWLSGK
jgi:hypothetical protein